MKKILLFSAIVILLSSCGSLKTQLRTSQDTNKSLLAKNKELKTLNVRYVELLDEDIVKMHNLKRQLEKCKNDTVK
jgi:uncharacterized protein YceK